MTRRILVTEKVADIAIDTLKGRGYDVDVMLDLSPEELIGQIAPYDALIIRSQTMITPELLDAAENLKIIGRAGVTIDNIDLLSAQEHGVIVCNAPASNIVSATEHTIALMLAAARMIPQANRLMHDGGWQRHCFLGTELYGKTLAIFGLGRVGSAVAERARAFGMSLIAHDPYCSDERAASLGVELLDDIDEVLARADFITVHLPLTDDTYGMFAADEFAKMKTGVIVVNCARGGIVDIDALADFVAAGKVAAAAVDVFENEPCYDSPLHSLENVILTPHISAVTKEAQIRAGEQIAQYVWQGLESSIVPTAIKVTELPPEVMTEIRPYAPAATILGSILVQLLGHIPKSVSVSLQGRIADGDPEPVLVGLLDGLLSYKKPNSTAFGDAVARAGRHGISLATDSSEDAKEYSSALKIVADGAELACTLFGLDNACRIISIMGYEIDIAPATRSLVFEYVDGPGRIGVIGTILGDAGVNITTMQIGNKLSEKCALVYVNVEGDVSPEVIDLLKDAIELKNIWYITL